MAKEGPLTEPERSGEFPLFSEIVVEKDRLESRRVACIVTTVDTSGRNVVHYSDRLKFGDAFMIIEKEKYWNGPTYPRVDSRYAFEEFINEG